MNTQFCKWLVSFATFFCLIIFTSTVIAGKPVKPPKPPKPDPEPIIIGGSACVDSGSFFPAFAYTVSTNLDNDPYQEYSEIFLSNAEGDCAIKIYMTDDDWWASHLSYRYFPDNTGSIVFTEAKLLDDLWAMAPPKIKILNFSIDEGAIVEELPLTSTLLVQAPEVDGIRDGTLGSPDLSPMGDRVVFRGSNNVDNHFIDEIIIDCASNPQCRQRIFETQPDSNGDDVYLADPHYSLEKERVYFELGHPNKKVVFIEKEDGNWPALNYDSDPSLSSDPTLILDGAGDVLHLKSVGLWDHDGDNFAQEVIAVTRRITSDFDSIEILDVEVCLKTDSASSGSCVVIGMGSDSGTIEGNTLLPASFTSFNENPPALLLRKYIGRKNEAGSIREFNLNNLSERIVVNAVKDRKKGIFSVDSAD